MFSKYFFQLFNLTAENPQKNSENISNYFFLKMIPNFFFYKNNSTFITNLKKLFSNINFKFEFFFPFILNKPITSTLN